MELFISKLKINISKGSLCCQPVLPFAKSEPDYPNQSIVEKGNIKTDVQVKQRSNFVQRFGFRQTSVAWLSRHSQPAEWLPRKCWISPANSTRTPEAYIPMSFQVRHLPPRETERASDAQGAHRYNSTDRMPGACRR